MFSEFPNLEPRIVTIKLYCNMEYSLVERCQRFGETYFLHLEDSTFLF